MTIAMTWVNFEAIMLSEISQMEKDKYIWFSHTWNIKNSKINKPSKKKQVDTETEEPLAEGKSRGESEMRKGINCVMRDGN